MTAPWLSQRRVEAAYGRSPTTTSPAPSPRRARPAISTRCRSSRCGPGRSPTPRSPDPSLTLRRYTDATELQPENSDTWFALGAYELGIGRFRDAYLHLDRAYGLDPYGPAGVPGGQLDRARAGVSRALSAGRRRSRRARRGGPPAYPVERRHDLHAAVVRESGCLRGVAAAVHDDAPRVVVPRGVPDLRDHVARGARDPPWWRRSRRRRSR